MCAYSPEKTEVPRISKQSCMKLIILPLIGKIFHENFNICDLIRDEYLDTTSDNYTYAILILEWSYSTWKHVLQSCSSFLKPMKIVFISNIWCINAHSWEKHGTRIVQKNITCSKQSSIECELMCSCLRQFFIPISVKCLQSNTIIHL